MWGGVSPGLVAVTGADVTLFIVGRLDERTDGAGDGEICVIEESFGSVVGARREVRGMLTS